MKVIFKFSKSLGNSNSGEEKEMFSTTAAVLERKGFGKITEKIVSVKKKGGGFEVKTEELSKKDRADMRLDESLVKKSAVVKTESK